MIIGLHDYDRTEHYQLQNEINAILIYNIFTSTECQAIIDLFVIHSDIKDDFLRNIKYFNTTDYIEDVEYFFLNIPEMTITVQDS